MLKKLLIVSSCALVVAVAAGTPDARATVKADASAGINWNSFSYTLSPGMTLNWGDRQTSLYVSAGNWQSSYADNWSDDKAVTASHPSGSATASADAQVLKSQSSSSGNDYSDSWAERYGSFGVIGSGNVTFTIAEYSQALDLLADGSGEYASGFSQIRLELQNQSYGEKMEALSHIGGFAGEWEIGDSYSAAKKGRPLSLTMYFAGGEEGYFYAGANTSIYSSTPASSPTPVPAAAWLLGSGLVGLAGLRRRKEIANA